MPLSCSMGTKKNYPRNMVLMNVAQEDFTRDMVMRSKKEDLLSNKDSKQQFITMLGQSLEHVGCETRHAKGDADVLIVETTVHSAMSCETTLVGDDTDLLVLVFSNPPLIPFPRMGIFVLSIDSPVDSDV